MNDVTKDAELLDLPVNYAAAIREWYAAGKPMRSDEEVRFLLETFCNPPDGACEKYDKRLGVLGYCRACGCNVNESHVGYLNALRMATKGCPLNKFSPYPHY